MEVKGLGHLVLHVRDLERSRRFYADVLGWREVRGDMPVAFPAAAFSSGGPSRAALDRGRSGHGAGSALGVA